MDKISSYSVNISLLILHLSYWLKARCDYSLSHRNINYKRANVIFGNQLHASVRFSVVEQQTVTVHTVAALPSDQAADLPKLSCFNFNEHLTSFPVTLNKSENTVGNIITLLCAFHRSEDAYKAAYANLKA